MTDCSSKLLQIQGKWYQERKPKIIPKPELPKKKISKPIFFDPEIMLYLIV